MSALFSSVTDLAPAAPVTREGLELTLAVPLERGWLLVRFEAEGAFAAEVAARPQPVVERPDAFTRAVLGLRALLERLRKRVATHEALLAAIDRQCGSRSELSAMIRLFSINAMIAAQRVADGDEIGAVAGLMQQRS